MVDLAYNENDCEENSFEDFEGSCSAEAEEVSGEDYWDYGFSGEDEHEGGDFCGFEYSISGEEEFGKYEFGFWDAFDDFGY